VSLLSSTGWPTKLVVLLLAFFARLTFRLVTGEHDFWVNGYSAYYDLALRLVGGHGLCFGGDGAGTCAYWPPVYPTLLAAAALTPSPYLTIVVSESLIGASTVLCAILLAEHLFDRVTGLIAGIVAALYPYFLIHDTALQETSVYTCLTATAVLLFYRAARDKSSLLAVLAGAALGAALLTRASLIGFVPMSLLWLLCFSGGAVRERVQVTILAGGAFLIVVSPWLIRNTVRVGAPILTSQFGRFLWLGNNAQTFSHYPLESIDLSAGAAWEALRPEEVQEIEHIDSELGSSNWFALKGTEYIFAHPKLTVQNSLRKIAAGFSWRLNPRREWLAEAVYGLSYGPVLVLAIAGAIVSRRDWRRHLLIYLLFLNFLSVTAVFWAHTSHRSHLDVYSIVFVAAAIGEALVILVPRSTVDRTTAPEDRAQKGSQITEYYALKVTPSG
jgi:4-amino-4-deoxy-L-arabinose transferase-like glycosyltransferase